MGADHEQTPIADTRDVPRVECSVDCAILTNHVSVADGYNTGMLGHVHVLWHAAQHGAFHYKIVAAQHRTRFHSHAAHQVAAVAKYDTRLHYAERADANIHADLGVRADDGERVKRHGRVLSNEAGGSKWREYLLTATTGPYNAGSSH
jgi:hypothetical protein